MKAETVLTAAFIDGHADEAAAIVESATARDAAAVLAARSVASAAAVLARVDSRTCADCLVLWPEESAAALLAALPGDAASRALRSVDEADRRRLLDLADRPVAEDLRRALAFPPGTAGALMDPRAFTLPVDLEAGEALRRVRKEPREATEVLFVVDRSRQSLSGVLDLRDLLLAPASQTLAGLARPTEYWVPARAAGSSAASHPGWKLFELLPVLDRDKHIVGVLRRAAVEPHALVPATTRPTTPGGVGVDLAHLFWTVGAALLDPLLSAAPTAPSGADEGERP